MILKKISIGKRPFFGVCYISRKIAGDKYTFYLDFKGVLSSTPQVSVANISSYSSGISFIQGDIRNMYWKK
jgi:hypothetical protein